MSATFTNPVISGAPGEDHGDPFVIKYLDAFYLYHTGETSGRRGISVHRSTNLVDWEFEGYALEAAESGWAYSDLWAPEVVYERGTFYMYVSATRQRQGDARERWDVGPGDDSARRLGLARATDPLGPFVVDEHPLLDQWSIDGHPFRDDDGTMWLFYNVRTEATRFHQARGTGIVCDRLLAPGRLEGMPIEVTFPSQAWEGPYRDWYWNEGPYVLKRRGTYYQLYSGGFHADGSYAIGLARSTDPRGPWEKEPRNPIFRGGDRILGPGHNSFVFGPDAATPYVVYHGYVAGEGGRKVHLDRLFWGGDRPVIVGPTEGEQSVPPAAVFDARVPHWRAETWVRGSWVEAQDVRLALDPADVWHQVEVVQAGGRYAVRVGGVLREARPAELGEPRFASDGEVGPTTVSTCLEDGQIHDLPEGSAYTWRWGGADHIEVSLAVRGEVELWLGDRSERLRGRGERFWHVWLDHGGGPETIVVRALDGGAAVTDLAVYARR